MTRGHKHPLSGEALFGAFVQPCLDARLQDGAHSSSMDGAEVFTQERYDLYVELGKEGKAPTRDMLKRDFPKPVAELTEFAHKLGITHESMIWSHETVAKFWRTEHNKHDQECRVKRGTVVSCRHHKNNVVLVAIDHEGISRAVNLLHLPLAPGDVVSIHKLVVCEIREHSHQP